MDKILLLCYVSNFESEARDLESIACFIKESIITMEIPDKIKVSFNL